MVDLRPHAYDPLYVAWNSGNAQQFGDTLRMRRKAAGLSQEALAHAVGITKNHVQLLEAGRGASGANAPMSNPRMSTVYGLARALGTTPAELLPPMAQDQS